jgi:aminoglycoside phosphotransferase (APT) family kinase protein
MAREYRVIRSLAATGVPVPRAYAICEDPAVNDYPFYVMEYLDGVVFGEDIPTDWAKTPADRERLSLAYITTLARLHEVDPEAVGLGDFGRPQGFVERQIRRWGEQWERSKTAERPEIEKLQRRMRAALPAEGPPAIVHGDYRLGNLMFAKDDPGRVLAVLDWEMATLGDPLTDLGWVIMSWPGGPGEAKLGGDVAGNGHRWLEGLPGRDRLAAEYVRAGGREPESLDFYVVLALYKLTVIMEGIRRRFLQGETVGEGFDRADRAPELLALALDLCAKSEDARLQG